MPRIVLSQEAIKGNSWIKEVAIRRTARRPHLCNECGARIDILDDYIDDIFYYNAPENFRPTSFAKHHRVCMECWKGPI